MLFYHENQTDEINLDKEPLLRNFKRNLNSNNSSNRGKQTCIFSNDISICIEDYYLTKLDKIMSKEYENDSLRLDENGNVKYSSRAGLSNSEQEALSSDLDAGIEQNLLGIFVVSFDTRLGNIIEWQIPSNLNLEQIEFKAMASGFHLIQSDLVYFCKDHMYGLAAFQSIRIENLEERNVRMKSVGLIAKSYKFLKKYSTFLKNQVRYQLETPGNYDSLISLWEKKSISNLTDFLQEQKTRNEIQTNTPTSSIIDKLFNKRLTMYKELSSINQSDYRIYTKFALYFGPSIFCLWKYALLNKRIVFYSSPPINDLCSRVICTNEMINTNLELINKKQLIKPYFYVNVTDIDKLQDEPFYIACTTEKIFQNKAYLYDLFVSESQINSVLADQKNLLKVNSCDKKRYDLLLKKITDLTEKQSNIFSRISNIDDDESLFIEFFTELNNKIFSILEDLEYEEEESSSYGFEVDNNKNFNMGKVSKHSAKRHKPYILTNEQIKKMGLDPSDDRDFLNGLIRFYDFNIILN